MFNILHRPAYALKAKLGVIEPLFFDQQHKKQP